MPWRERSEESSGTVLDEVALGGVVVRRRLLRSARSAGSPPNGPSPSGLASRRHLGEPVGITSCGENARAADANAISEPSASTGVLVQVPHESMTVELADAL